MGKCLLNIAILITMLSAIPLLAVEENGWVVGRIAEMTLREKIGQMMMVGIYGDRITVSEAKYLVDNAIGNIILFDQNITDEDQLAGMTSYLQEAVTASSGIPLIIAVDQEGGPVNRIGKISGLKYTRHNANTLGKTFAFAPRKAHKALYNANLVLGKRMQELGINMNLAPVLDLAPERTSYIHSRSYGSSPDIVTAAAKSVVGGLKATNIISTGKHFPNLGYSKEDSHHILPVINRSISELKKYEFLPFFLLKDEIDAIMIGHVLVPDLDKIYPASISKSTINVLRHDIGFSGLIISDDLKMKALTMQYTVPEIGIRSVIAGNDILLAAWEKDKQVQIIDAIEKAVRRKVITEAQINESVARILTVKYKYLIAAE
jgi:beta-N-acetylhexosaminidase